MQEKCMTMRCYCCCYAYNLHCSLPVCHWQGSQDTTSCHQKDSCSERCQLLCVHALSGCIPNKVLPWYSYVCLSAGMLPISIQLHSSALSVTAGPWTPLRACGLESSARCPMTYTMSSSWMCRCIISARWPQASTCAQSTCQHRCSRGDFARNVPRASVCSGSS